MFLLRSTLRFPISLTNRRAVGNVSLIEMQRNEGTSSVIPSMPRVASWEDGSDCLNLEIGGATGECPRSHVGEMAFVTVTPDDMDVFFQRSSREIVWTVT